MIAGFFTKGAKQSSNERVIGHGNVTYDGFPHDIWNEVLWVNVLEVDDECGW